MDYIALSKLFRKENNFIYEKNKKEFFIIPTKKDLIKKINKELYTFLKMDENKINDCIMIFIKYYGCEEEIKNKIVEYVEKTKYENKDLIKYIDFEDYFIV